MAMKDLDPAVAHHLSPDWTLCVTQYGATMFGHRYVVELLAGTATKDSTTYEPAKPESRQAAASHLAHHTLPTLDATALEAALVQLKPLVEQEIPHQKPTKPPSQATIVLDLATDAKVELFHDPDLMAYASVPIDNHLETFKVRSTAFRHWLSRLFLKHEGKAVGGQGLQDALNTLESQAIGEGAEYPVFLRCASHQDVIYMDMGDERWRALEITGQGWGIVDKPPVKFRRAPGMLPLPEPVAGADLIELAPFVNIEDGIAGHDWVLLTSWLLAAMRPTGPHPVLVLNGEQGSAKSSLTRVLRSLIDPNNAAVRRPPKDERDFAIAAQRAWLVAYDNLSYLSDTMSDAFCCLATGAAFATRQLYTDDEEVILQMQRPSVMNGIGDLATRADLLDRSIMLSLPVIEEADRKDERVFWQEFDQARPRLLGALLESLSTALRQLPHTTLATLPRMADFALWAAAANVSSWQGQSPQGDLVSGAEAFMMAYAENQDNANSLALDASPLLSPLLKVVPAKASFRGTATELLEALNEYASKDVKRSKRWPKDPEQVGVIMRRLSANLRKEGIAVTFEREAGGHRREIVIDRP